MISELEIRCTKHKKTLNKPTQTEDLTKIESSKLRTLLAMYVLYSLLAIIALQTIVYSIVLVSMQSRYRKNLRNLRAKLDNIRSVHQEQISKLVKDSDEEIQRAIESVNAKYNYDLQILRRVSSLYLGSLESQKQFFVQQERYEDADQVQNIINKELQFIKNL